MRSSGKIVLCLGLFIICAVIVLAVLAISIGFATDDPDIVGFGMIFGMFFGIPLVILGAILTLIGAVLVTSTKKNTPPVAPTTPPPLHPALIRPGHARSSDNTLRAAILKGPSRLHTIALLMRVAAVGVFLWIFISQTYPSLRLYAYIGTFSAKDYVLIIGMGVVLAAIIPLIMWLVSNLIKNRAYISDGAPA